MSNWPKFREGIVAFWHSVLDYDQNLSKKKQESIRLERERKKSLRLRSDQSLALKARMDVLAKNKQAGIEQKRRREQSEIEKRRSELTPPNHLKPTCPFCGYEMKRSFQSTDSGVGCLILIIGLVFSPILIGIPLVFVGCHYMSKKRTIVICPSCGVENR